MRLAGRGGRAARRHGGAAHSAPAGAARAGARAHHPAVGRLQPRFPRGRRPTARARLPRVVGGPAGDRVPARGRGGAALGAALGGLAPSLFPDVGVLRDARVNVGHWNLPERSVEDIPPVPLQRLRARRARPGDALRRPACHSALNGASEYFARYREACSTPAGRRRSPGRTRSRASPTARRSAACAGLYDELGGERFADPFAVGPRARSRPRCASRSTRAGPRSAGCGWSCMPGGPTCAPPILTRSPPTASTFARWTRDTGAREHGLPGRSTCARGRRGTRAVVTIIGRSRLPAARVLAASLREHRPDVACHVVVADELEHGGGGAVRRARRARARARPPTSSAGCAPPARAVRTDPAPLARACSTRATRPFAAPRPRRVGVSARSLEPLWHAVERSAIVLTPHLAAPPEGPGARAPVPEEAATQLEVTHFHRCQGHLVPSLLTGLDRSGC